MTSIPARRLNGPLAARLLTNALILLLLISGGVNVLLARRIEIGCGPPRRGLPSGTLLPALTGVSPDGRRISLGYAAAAGHPTILYYFSPQCAWCERNWPNLRALVNATRERYRWIGVSTRTTEDLAAFAAARDLHIDIVTDVPEATLREYRFGGTPQTLVIGSDGRLIAGWMGAFQDALALEIERFFGVTLPGLAPPRPAAAAPGVR